MNGIGNRIDGNEEARSLTTQVSLTAHLIWQVLMSMRFAHFGPTQLSPGLNFQKALSDNLPLII